MKKLLLTIILGLGAIQAQPLLAQRDIFFAQNGAGASVSCGTPGSNSDSFAGSASTPLATHNPCWITYDTTNYEVGNLVLAGSGIVQTVGIFSDGGALYSGDTSSTSQITVSGGASGTAAAIVRAITSTQGGYGANLASLSGGNYTSLTIFGNTIFSSCGGTWSAASSHDIKIVAVGTTSPITVNAYVDTILCYTGTDSGAGIYSTGYSGFRAAADTSSVTHVQVANWRDN